MTNAMTDTDAIREIQRLMDESRDTAHAPEGNARRIAELLGIEGDKDEGVEENPKSEI